jgi:hypothetical protein
MKTHYVHSYTFNVKNKICIHLDVMMYEHGYQAEKT